MDAFSHTHSHADFFKFSASSYLSCRSAPNTNKEKRAQMHRLAGARNGSGIVRATTNPVRHGVSQTDACLVIVQNRTSEGVTVTAEARTPAGQSFLDTMTADLDPSGSLTLLSCAGNDLQVDFSRGLHRLFVQQNGELRLLPGLGLRQKMVPAGASVPAKYILYVDLEDVVPSHDHQHPSLEDIVKAHPCCSGIRSVATVLDTLPYQCTVLAPKTLPQEFAALDPGDLLKHLSLPVALFCNERKGGAEIALDGALVHIQTLPTGIVVFSIEASASAPALRLHSHSAPLRCAERFQVVYSCELC